MASSPKAPRAQSGGLSAEIDNSANRKHYPTALGRNIGTLRKECGWSFDDLAKASDLDKKLILGHVNDGKGTHPKTVKSSGDP
jgi:hypothetical protein